MCYECHEEDLDKSVGKLSSVVDGVMKALTFSKREEVKAWEQEFVPCEHTLCLTPQGAGEGQSIGKATPRPYTHYSRVFLTWFP